MRFRYVPHPHVERRKAQGPVRVRDQHGTGINGRIAVAITRRVGTMWAAYAFAILAVVSLPAALRSGDPVVLVSWISQTFLQLVLLAVIMVGQDVQAQAADKRAEQTFLDVEAILHEQRQIEAHLNAQDAARRDEA